MIKATLGVDTGGTFTDLIARDARGQLHVHKLLSSPEDPSSAIAQGAMALASRLGLDASQLAMIHGTTVATNALLERKGARVILITTQGHEDVLALRRQQRPELYALTLTLAKALVRPEDCLGVPARRDHAGRVLTPLTPQVTAQVVARALARVDQALREDGEQAQVSVAIALLHAYADPADEQALWAALTAARPSLFVTASAHLSREPREYERASTAAVNAFVGPLMQRYLARIEQRLTLGRLEIFASSGARMSAARAALMPAHTALSGPAGGVVGALTAARQLGVQDIITLDMGGTSTDVSLCVGGQLQRTDQAELDGLALQLPLVDLYTVGAGGGSIARLDVGGALRVGPESAGAWPGPAAYGQGGQQATVTDAHLVLGRLRADRFLGGQLMLNVDAARQALERLAQTMDMSVEDAARGVLSIADAAMTRAIKVISLERGHDPRDFTLVCFGGAGGLHACRLADALELRAVIIPKHPGLLSAYGMLHAQPTLLDARTIMAPLSAALDPDDPASALLAQALRELASSALDALGASARVEISAQLRYSGQSFALSIPTSWSAQDAQEDPLARFTREHERLYGWTSPGRLVELVSVRALATLDATPDAEADSPQQAAQDAAPTPRPEPPTARVCFERGWREDAWIIERDQLQPDERLVGPGVLTEYSGTTVVPQGWVLHVRQGGHLLLTRIPEDV